MQIAAVRGDLSVKGIEKGREDFAAVIPEGMDDTITEMPTYLRSLAAALP